MKEVLRTWHLFVASKDPKYLDELLAEDAVFYSPVVHTPQKGKAICKAYLMAAMEVLGTRGTGFEYLQELVNETKAVLEFTTQIEGVSINGIDMLQINEEGKIIEFKVMVRPLKAIHLIHEKMGEQLLKMKT